MLQRNCFSIVSLFMITLILMLEVGTWCIWLTGICQLTNLWTSFNGLTDFVVGLCDTHHPKCLCFSFDVWNSHILLVCYLAVICRFPCLFFVPVQFIVIYLLTQRVTAWWLCCLLYTVYAPEADYIKNDTKMNFFVSLFFRQNKHRTLTTLVSEVYLSRIRFVPLCF